MSSSIKWISSFPSSVWESFWNLIAEMQRHNFPINSYPPVALVAHLIMKETKNVMQSTKMGLIVYCFLLREDSLSSCTYCHFTKCFALNWWHSPFHHGWRFVPKTYLLLEYDHSLENKANMVVFIFCCRVGLGTTFLPGNQHWLLSRRGTVCKALPAWVWSQTRIKPTQEKGYASFIGFVANRQLLLLPDSTFPAFHLLEVHISVYFICASKKKLAYFHSDVHCRSFSWLLCTFSCAAWCFFPFRSLSLCFELLVKGDT